MNIEPFYTILNRAMGLASESLGRSGVEHAVNVRMRETGLDEAQYLRLLRTSDSERAELVEEVVVPETWFFRDSKPFELLYETVFRHQGDFRVLSAPCSTGEEPYSIAMTLLGAGVGPERFSVDGVDISERALQKARRAVYSDNSFRADLPVYAQVYFSRCEQGRKLDERITQTVNFYAGNIVEGCLPQGTYDAIFCRNLLIYLDEKSKKCLAALLNEKLKDGGLLFVGHAEQLSMFNEYFIPVRRQGVFALRKSKAGVAKQSERGLCSRPQCDLHEVVHDFNPPKMSGDRLISKLETVLSAANQDPPEKVETVVDERLSTEDVKRLADRGQITEALVECEKLIREMEPDSELLHLKGLLHETEGNISMAEDCYGKALYLDPDHLASLVHLALLVENRGDSRKAELLRDRVRRAEKRKKDS